jgi:hypothetical protein
VELQDTSLHTTAHFDMLESRENRCCAVEQDQAEGLAKVRQFPAEDTFRPGCYSAGAVGRESPDRQPAAVQVADTRKLEDKPEYQHQRPH